MLHREAGWGFSYIRLDSPKTMHKVLSLTPHRFVDDTTLFRSWISSFDPRCLVGLAIPVWISLRLLPLEFFDYVRTVAAFMGRVIDKDPMITVTQDSRFYVELDLEKD